MSVLFALSGSANDAIDPVVGKYDPVAQLWTPSLVQSVVTMTGTSTYPTMSATTDYGRDDDKDDEQADPEPEQ